MLKHTRTILLTAMLALLVAAPVASAKTNHKYSSTVMASPVWTANGYPNPGGWAVLSGSLMTKPGGPGTVTDTVAITGQPNPNTFAFNGVEVAQLVDGTVRSTFTGTTTVQDDGSQNLVINGRIIRGTGRYNGATGSYTFTGKIPPGSTVITGTSTGSIAY